MLGDAIKPCEFGPIRKCLDNNETWKFKDPLITLVWDSDGTYCGISHPE